MEKIYELREEYSVIFFDRGRQLIMQHKEGERIGRPVLLANDYESGFGGILYEDTFYYVYVTVDGELLLRNIRDNMVYYRIAGEGRIPVPLRLSVRQGQLMLWYLEDGHGKDGDTEAGDAEAGKGTEQTRCLKCACPFQPQRGQIVLEGISAGESVCIFESDGDVLIITRGDGENRARNIYLLDEELKMKKLETEENFETVIQSTVQDQTNKLRMLLKEMEDNLQNEREVWGEKERNMQEKLQKERESIEILQQNNLQLEQQIAEKDAQLGRFQGMIESAKQQYEELMHVAEQYRDEAVKWRSKFIF